MPKLTKKPTAQKHTAAGRRLIRSVKQAIAWASGEDVPVRVTMVSVECAPVADVRAVRQKLGLSQSQFAARFGFTPATVKNWEQGRTQPDGPARVLLTVIAHHPEAVEDALRKASAGASRQRQAGQRARDLLLPQRIDPSPRA
jgi:putative transcriptional regulator